MRWIVVCIGLLFARTSPGQVADFAKDQYERATKAFEGGDWTASIQLFTDVLEISKDPSLQLNSRYFRGYSYYKLGQCELAIDDLGPIMKLDATGPNTEQVKLARLVDSFCRASSGRIECGSENVVLDMAKSFPTPEDRLQFFARASKQCPESAELKFRWALANEELWSSRNPGRYDESVGFSPYWEILKIDKGHERANYRLAVWFYRRSRFSTAMMYLRAYFESGLSFSDTHTQQKARRLFVRAEWLDRLHPDIQEDARAIMADPDLDSSSEFASANALTLADEWDRASGLIVKAHKRRSEKTRDNACAALHDLLGKAVQSLGLRHPCVGRLLFWAGYREYGVCDQGSGGGLFSDGYELDWSGVRSDGMDGCSWSPLRIQN